MAHDPHHLPSPKYKDKFLDYSDQRRRVAIATSIHNSIYCAIERLEFMENDLRIIEEDKVADTVHKMIDSLSKARDYIRNKHIDSGEDSDTETG